MEDHERGRAKGGQNPVHNPVPVQTKSHAEGQVESQVGCEVAVPVQVPVEGNLADAVQPRRQDRHDKKEEGQRDEHDAFTPVSTRVPGG